MKKFILTLALGILAVLPANAQVNAPADVTKPIISSVSTSNITKDSATISWTTNEPATSYVDFGPTDIYGNTLGDGAMVSAHSVSLLGMTPETLYHFRIRSKDAAGNEAVSTDTTFTTLAASANANTNQANANINSATNANANKNTNANKNSNANANKNANVNKNSNANKNLNANKNSNANLNANSAPDSTDNSNANENLNTDAIDSDFNANATDLNVETETGNSDGRLGVVLIIIGVGLLIAVVIFAWRKFKRTPTLKP
ncbi:fibronectin type III domain-containing protein [Candidatus Parcubacteria bacterium]|jgi:hypothetical protein|nr:MAG: fibronectin type III domain-containing protein [Candidatus Parcubacteria bacterium]